MQSRQSFPLAISTRARRFGGVASPSPGAARAGYPGWTEQVVIAVRLLTYWNSKRISAELRRRQIADVGETWIEALFDRFGTARPSLPREAGPRYERSQPNEL